MGTKAKKPDAAAGNWIEKLRPMRTDFKPLMREEAAAVAAAEAAMDLQRGLPRDLKHLTRAQRRTVKDLRQARTAAEHLERLPEADEAFHCVIRGNFALWDMVPAALALAAPHRIEALHVATLGFSKANAEALFGMLDRRDVATATLLCSHYFSATSKEIYELMSAGMLQRRQPFVSMRTHAKLLAMRFADGRTLTVESSANLRSCKNIEQMTFIGSPELYAFHVAWINEVCSNARTQTNADADPGRPQQSPRRRPH